jgi:uncharacterized membrane protein YqhA
MRKVELIIEAIIFQSRWLLAPFYLGLAFCLLLLLYHSAYRSTSSCCGSRMRAKPT